VSNLVYFVDIKINNNVVVYSNNVIGIFTNGVKAGLCINELELG